MCSLWDGYLFYLIARPSKVTFCLPGFSSHQCLMLMTWKPSKIFNVISLLKPVVWEKNHGAVPLSSEVGISRRKIGESSRTPSSQFGSHLYQQNESCVLHHLLTTRSVIKMSHRQYFTASTCSTCFHVVCRHVHPAFPTYHWNVVNSNVTSSVAQISEGYRLKHPWGFSRKQLHVQRVYKARDGKLDALQWKRHIGSGFCVARHIG